MIGLVIPWWGRWVALAALTLAVFGYGCLKGAQHVREQWDAAVAARVIADNAAIVARMASNADLAAKQRATNLTITKDKDESLAPVIARAQSDRVRVGTALCSGAASPATSPSAPGGDSRNPPGRLVQPDIERDIVALKIAVETDLATGRSCQRFLIDNGLVP